MAHLVSMDVDLGETDPERVHSLIDIMYNNHFPYLLVLSPELFRKILAIAFRLNIRKDFVRFLAMKRLGISFTDQGEIIPVLSMLVSSRHGYLNVEDIQVAFWPEKTAAKGRASFDTMISRLRKVISKAVAPQPVSHYFNLKKEQLRLENTIVDVHDFIENAELGLKLAEKKQFWQGENEFRRAFMLFDGTGFMPGIVPDQTVHTFKEYFLRPLISECTGTWSRVMLESPEYIPKDMELLEKLITADSENIELVRNLYQLKCRHESNPSANRLIKKYKETLRVEGFFADEIDWHSWATPSGNTHSQSAGGMIM